MFVCVSFVLHDLYMIIRHRVVYVIIILSCTWQSPLHILDNDEMRYLYMYFTRVL